MPDTNVIQMPDANALLGQRYAAACERTTHGRQEWIEGSLEKAAILIEARQRNSDQAFGAWVRANDYDHLDPNERADLMNLGSNPALMRAALEATDSIRYRLIWSEARIRYSTNTIPNSEPAPDASSGVRSTGRGPWNNIIDARLTALFHEHGNHPTVLAPLLTRDHPEMVADRPDRSYTPGMCQTAMRRLGLVPQSPSRSAPAPAAAPAPRPRPPLRGPTVVVGGDTPAVRPLTREQMDPTWTDADGIWTARHGHVNQLTAAQRSTNLFSSVTVEMRAAVDAIRATPDQILGRGRATFDAYWLRHLTNPRPRDVARLAEALAYLRPHIAEAEEALARAQAVQPPVAATGPATGDLARPE